MQAIFELFFQFASIQLRAQQEQVEKNHQTDDELQAGWAGGEAPYEVIDTEWFWKLDPCVILWG